MQDSVPRVYRYRKIIRCGQYVLPFFFLFCVLVPLAAFVACHWQGGLVGRNGRDGQSGLGGRGF